MSNPALALDAHRPGLLRQAELDVKAGDDVAVFGLGPVGLSGVILAKARGGRIIGVDILDKRAELATKLGADAVVNAANEDPVGAIRNFTNGKGAALASEASGSSKGRSDMVSCLRRGGKAVFVGAESSEKVINPGLLIGSQLMLMGSFVLPLWLTWGMVDFVDSQAVSFEGGRDAQVFHRGRA